MRTIKRLAPLVVSVALVLGLGAASIAVSASASGRARDVHRMDRQTLNKTLAGLANQFVKFSFKEAYDFASDQEWSLRPGDSRDTARLAAFIERSSLLQHGAALVALDGTPLNAFSNPPGLPDPMDPGYAPLRRDLAGGQPGVSSLMKVSGVPVVALAVPVIVDGSPRAVFVGFFRADTGPLQVYSERLDHGPRGVGHILDSDANVVAATHRRFVGTRMEANPALQAVTAGKTGFEEFEQGGERMTGAYAPIGIGGWSDVILQPADEFFGEIDEGGRNAVLAVLLLLVAAAAALTVLNFFRERALRHAYEYKGQLLANTTHELKTPLTAIRGAAITLGTRWRQMPADSVEQLLGMIHRRTEGLGKLVDRILMGARLDAGRDLLMHPQDVELAGVLRRIATEFADCSPRHRFTITAADGVSAHVDPDALDQVVGMLVENGMKYSPEGGEIRLAATAVGESVAVHVGDDGIGISPEEQRHIFDPYYRANRGDDQAFGGVGLGLSICRHLVRLNGGEISVDSKLDQGTTFSFTLRRAASDTAGTERTDAVRGWVPVAEAARSAGVHPSTVRSWLREGRVRSETVDVDGRSRTVVAVEDIESRARRGDAKRKSHTSVAAGR